MDSATSQPHVSVIDKQLCLSLNRSWSPIGYLTIKKALVAMCSESDGERPAYALDITMGVDENGNDILVYANPTTFEDWIKLPVRDGDLSVLTRNGPIRAPTVIVSANFDRSPLKRPRLTSHAIWERDGGICQYSGVKLSRATGNLDHVVPRDRGGKDTFENLVLAHKDINSRKGNRLNSEAGLILLRQPKAPPSLPVSATITEARHPTWGPFLIKRA